MQEQNPNEQEVKREIPNQHLADRIAGKVDEQGKELSETQTEVSNIESEVPNQHLSDKIAGKVDHNNTSIQEQLGEVPEELPTHLGGVEMETVVEEVVTETTTTDSTETTTTETEEVAVATQSETSVDDGAQKGEY